jgi:putative hydrolase of the HAD superfamily
MTGTRRLRVPAAIVLDLDGTVLDNSGLADAAAQACALVSGTLGRVDMERLLSANTEAWAQVWDEVENACWLGHMDGYAASREAWRRSLEACGCNDASALEFAFSQYRCLAQATFRLYSDVQGFLDYAAARGIRLGLVTNGPSDVQRDKVDALGISRHIRAVVISGEHGVAKPDPAIFEVALDLLGVGPSEAWCVGDSLDHDIAGALSVGMTALWLNRRATPTLGFGAGGTLAGQRLADSRIVPHAELESMSQLTELLRDR